MAITPEQAEVLIGLKSEIEKSEVFMAWHYHLSQCWICGTAKDLTVLSGENVFPDCEVGLSLCAPALEYLKEAYEKALAKPEPESRPND